MPEQAGQQTTEETLDRGALESLLDQEELALEPTAEERKANFKSGFDKGQGNQVGADADPEPEPEPQPEPQPEPEPEPDPLAVALADNERLRGDVRSAHARYGTLNREILDIKKKIGGGGEQGSDEKPMPTFKEVREAMTSGDKYQALKADWPEHSEAFDEAFGPLIDRLESTEGIDADKIRQEAVTEARGEFETKLNDAVIGAQHDDWQDTLGSGAFWAWSDAQTDPAIRAQLESSNPRDVVKLLNVYSPQLKELGELVKTQDAVTQAAYARMIQRDPVIDTLNDAERREYSNKITLESKVLLDKLDKVLKVSNEKPANRSQDRSRLEQNVPATTGGTTSARGVPTRQENFRAGFKKARGY